MREALTTMLRMQDRMNKRVHPQWIEQHFEWHRAIWVECAELVDHHGYKWWKHQTPDQQQVQLEAIDIWHFGMSARFKPELSIEDLAQLLEEEWHAAESGSASGVLEAAEQLAGLAALERRFCVASFRDLLRATGLDFAALFRQYLGKNVLNMFRQDHGYKDGSYRKLWAGREDNEHLMELLEAIDTSSADAEEALYRLLAERYAATA
ncbi:MAG: hypothetical protein ACI87W_003116 [Halieaceae bacterium]|jgi:hypothetical protein